MAWGLHTVACCVQMTCRPPLSNDCTLRLSTRAALQAFLTAARQRIEELSRVERDLHSRYGHGGGGAPGDLHVFSSEFDIQPHLVLDPDGVSILMARKLKQQSEDGAGEGAPRTEQVQCS